MGLVKSLANEFGKDRILVNNVGPGFAAIDPLKELGKTRAAASGKTDEMECPNQHDYHAGWSTPALL